MRLLLVSIFCPDGTVVVVCVVLSCALKHNPKSHDSSCGVCM
jgi:hypothetical protein